MLKSGVLLGSHGGGSKSVRLRPALTFGEVHAEQFMGVLDEVLGKM